MKLLSKLAIAALVSAAVSAQAPLPNQPGSLKFAVIGDSGTGERPQYEVADQMAKPTKGNGSIGIGCASIAKHTATKLDGLSDV